MRTVIIGRAGRGLSFSILHPYAHLIMILPNLNHSGGKKKSEICSGGICLMLSTFKVSAKLLQLFLSIRLEEIRFFRQHLGILALY